jgi:hypothetical protein
MSAQQARELFDRTDDGPGRAATAMQLGYLAADDGNPHRAREFQERAAVLWKAFARNTGWLPPILLELAELDAEVGEHERVPERLSEAIQILRRSGDHAGVLHCRSLLGLATNAPLTAE